MPVFRHTNILEQNLIVSLELEQRVVYTEANKIHSQFMVCKFVPLTNLGLADLWQNEDPDNRKGSLDSS